MDKYKKLFSNTIIFAMGSFGSKLLVFLMVRFYTGQLSTAEFSTADIIVQTANFLIPLATLSIAESITRFGLDRDYDNTKIFTAGIFTVLIGMTGLAVLFPLINLVHMFDGYGMLLYVYVYTSSFRALCSQFVRARGLVKLYAFDGILTTFVMILLNILMLAVFHWGIHGYILSIVLSDSSSILFLTIAAKLPKFIRFNKLDSDLTRTMLRYSIPLIPSAVLFLVISVSDRYFVRGMISDEANGIYTAANKLPQIVAIVSAFFTQAWHMSAITESNAKDTAKFYGKVFGAYQSVMYIATAGIILLNKPIMKILVDKSYFEAYKYIPMLIFGMLMMVFGSFLSSVYAATKHTVNSLVTSFLSAGTNIVLNILLIPKLGIQGAAFATLISYAVCYFIRLFDTRRYIHFHVDFGMVIINTLAITVMTVISLIEPKNMYIWLIIGCVLITAINFKAVIRTIVKVMPHKKA